MTDSESTLHYEEPSEVSVAHPPSSLPFFHSVTHASAYSLTPAIHIFIHAHSPPTHSPVHLPFIILPHTIHPSAHPHICPSVHPAVRPLTQSLTQTSHPYLPLIRACADSGSCSCLIHPSISCSTCLPSYPSVCHPLMALLPSSSLLLEGGKPLYCYSRFSALCLCGFSDKRLIHRRKGC